MEFMCKYCNKTYSCGKALGGHLSSHKMVSPFRDVHGGEEEGEDFGGRGKKAERSRTTIEVQGDRHHVCKECGKGFQSLKALCGHMACHSEKERPGSSRQRYESRIEDKRGRLYVDPEECSESAGDSGHMQGCRRSKRVRCMMTMSVEEVARCLMKMSNDRRSVGGCGGRIGDYSGSISVESEDKSPSSGGYSGSPKSSDEILFAPKRAYKRLGRLNSDYTKSSKREENARKSNHKHECPICFRVFKSGQAMGGHKRSHFLSGVEEVTGGAGTDRVILPEAHPLLDLSFPAFLGEGEGEGKGQSFRSLV